MAQFAYVARDSSGAVARGVLSALSIADAAKQLRGEGKYPVKVEPAQARGAGKAATGGAAGAPRTSGGGRYRSDDVIHFANQLTVLVDTGVSLAEGLAACRSPKNSPVFARALDAVIDQVQSGSPFSAALASQPRVFSPLFVNMVRASEASGQMGPMLVRVTEYLIGQRDLRKKIKGAITYPIGMMTFAIGVTVFLLTWVLPKFTKIYAGREAALPKSTRMLMNFSSTLTQHWLVIVASLAGVVAGLVLHARTPRGRQHIDWLKLRVPIVGPMIHKAYLARCLRTLGTMIESGVVMLEAVDLTRAAVSSGQFDRLWHEAIEDLQHGKQLSETLSRSSLIPSAIAQMVGAGERSGKLGPVLSRIAEHCEADLSVAVKSATAMLEPIIIGFLGTVVGGLVISLLLPIFTISRALKP
ncbi:MAG: type II secretion system F family protein [Phycisphaerae bacterium]